MIDNRDIIFPRRRFNSVFGDLKFDIPRSREGLEPYNTQTFSDSTKDYVLRQTGIEREHKNVQRAIQALASPENYLEQKNQDLIRIADELHEKFTERFEHYMNRYLSQKESIERATKDIIILKDRLYKEHYLSFPTRLREPTLVKGNK